LEVEPTNSGVSGREGTFAAIKTLDRGDYKLSPTLFKAVALN
jgi:hypothetical protein